MKKIFLLFATAAIFAACSNDDEVTPVKEETSVKLVDATIGFNMSQTATSRAFLGAIDPVKNTEDDSWNIAQDFELGDKMYITDYAGVHEFSVTDAGQTGKIKGKWGELQDGKNGIVAMGPKEAYRQKMTVDGDFPTMYFQLPTTQNTRSREGSGVSYDPKAALTFACADNKEDNLWFMSVCSYVYFYSKSQTATIKSTQNIGGNITLTYKGVKGTGKNATVNGVDYGSIDGLAKVMEISASAKTIDCTGVSISGHSNVFNQDYQGAFEYMIAVKPGTYNVGEFSIEPTGNEGKKNKASITMVPGGVYFIGCADKDADGAKNPTPEP